jgi:hypothetical protein
MTTVNFVIVVVSVLAAWAVASWVIWKWEPSERTWTVWCPV